MFSEKKKKKEKKRRRNLKKRKKGIEIPYSWFCFLSLYKIFVILVTHKPNYTRLLLLEMLILNQSARAKRK